MSYSLRERASSTSNDDFLAKFEERFTLMKDELIKEIRNEIRDEIKKDFEVIIKDQSKRITELESTVAVLQQHVQTLKHTQTKNSSSMEELEQYGRRLCLRIHGIPCKEGKETAGDVLKEVKDLITESKSEIPVVCVDRAHRIGKKNENEDGIVSQAIIVRFTTFRHRTLLYRNRKSLSEARVQLDLTKQRYTILKDARGVLKLNPELAKFVYADINCRLKVKFNDDKESFFESIDELNGFLGVD